MAFWVSFTIDCLPVDSIIVHTFCIRNTWSVCFLMFISQQAEGSDSKAGAELLDIVLKRVRDDSVTSYLAYVLTKENKEQSDGM